MKQDKKVKSPTNFKKVSQFAVAGLILTAAGGLAVNAAPVKGILNNSAAVSAIKSGDLNAYKEAVKSEETTRLNERLDSMTQEDLTNMKTRLENEQAREDAIKNNDWNAFNALQTTQASSATSTTDGKQGRAPRTVTQDEFNQMVSAYKIGQEYQPKLNDALKNSDQATFTSLMTEMRTKMDALKPAQTNVDGTTNAGKTRPELTAEQKTQMDQKMWERALSEYKADGTFEIKGFGMGGGKGMNGEMGGKRGHGGPDGDMGRVKDQVNTGSNTSTSISTSATTGA